METHVGGSIDAILSGMEQANAVYPVGKLKWKIAHPGNAEPTDAQLDRAKALGIGWSLTFSGVRTGPDRPALPLDDAQQRPHVPRHGRDERRRVGAVPDDLDGHFRARR